MRGIRYKSYLMGAAAGVAAILGAPNAFGADPGPNAGAGASAPVEEIVVTARRRSELIDRTPVAVQAFTPEKLNEANINSSQDLQKLVPGVSLTGGGGQADNTTFTIRGQGRFVIGGGLPSVISYVNEVPLGAWGAVAPTFDMANIQVLKGPQGTLFGRNTTGGAILLYTAQPSFDFNGYVQGLYGSHNWGDVQGAINIPIVKEKLAVRLAGDIVRRDGYTKVIGVGRDPDDLHSDSFRASVLFEPTDTIKNVTVYDYYHSDTGGTASIPTADVVNDPAAGGLPTYLARAGANAFFETLAFGSPQTGFPACGVSPFCDAGLAQKQQVAIGPRHTFSDVPTSHRSTIWGVSNTTSVDIGPVTIKNIFGVRANQSYDSNNTDGVPFALQNVDSWRTDRQITDEIQFTGTILHDHLDWLVGAFYLENDEPGPTALRFDAYRDPAFFPTPGSTVNPAANVLIPPGNLLGIPTSPIDPTVAQLLTVPLTPYYAGSAIENAFFNDQSRAVFAHFIYKFDGALKGFRLSAGIRYTSDREESCSQTTVPFNGVPEDGIKACTQAISTFGSPVSYLRSASNKLTWEAGADYQVTDSLFLYVVGRTGYRAGGLNTPKLGGSFATFQTYAPQSVTDVEVGAKSDWHWDTVKGRVAVALFHSSYDHIQRAVTGLGPDADGSGTQADDPSNTTLYINAGGAVVQGVELDGSISPFRDLNIAFGGAYLDAHVDPFPYPAAIAPFQEDFVKYDYAPKFSYNLAADYRLPFDTSIGEFWLHGDHYWIGSRNIGLVNLPAYMVENFSIEWKNIADKPISATVFIENAFDKTYIDTAVESGFGPGYHTVHYGPPRMFGFKLRYEFGGK